MLFKLARKNVELSNTKRNGLRLRFHTDWINLGKNKIWQSMGNPFIDIIRAAHIHKWCTTPYCTACGARDYRQALRQLGGEFGGGLADALADLSPSELVKEYNWQNALLIAIMDLPFSLQFEGIIKAWLPKFYED